MEKNHSSFFSTTVFHQIIETVTHYLGSGDCGLVAMVGNGTATKILEEMLPNFELVRLNENLQENHKYTSWIYC